MIISCANAKGGTGKTSTTALTAFELASQNKKILVIDCDPQSNLTQVYTKTIQRDDGVVVIDHSLFGMLINDIPLKKGIKNVKENLDFIPSAVDLNMLSRWLDKQKISELDKVSFLLKKITPLISDYDYIFLDVSPTMSLLNDNVFFACDYIVIMLQTQERALAGAREFIKYIQTNMVDQFDARVDVAGLVPVLSKKNAPVDKEILKKAAEEFGSENIFRNMIPNMERVKRFDVTGITTNYKGSRWDRATHEVYSAVANEMVRRIQNGTD